MNAISKAIELFGSQSALAETVGITQAVISQYTTGQRRPSAETAIAIELATDGKVRVEQLRPDVPWHVIRGRSIQDDAA